MSSVFWPGFALREVVEVWGTWRCGRVSFDLESFRLAWVRARVCVCERVSE